MYLPWGYDISMVSGTILYALTAIFGFETWKVKLPFTDSSPGPLFEFFLYLGSVGMALPVALRNIYRSYKDGTGKMRSAPEAIRPLVSFLIAMISCLLWAGLSPNQILHKDTRMFFYVCGTLCANMSCRLIVAQMSNTRCELFNFFLVPLMAAVGSSLLIPGLPMEGELSLLYILAVLLTVFHVHYGVCVVIQMSRHLKISALSIKDRGFVRLVTTTEPPAVEDSNDDDDDDEDASDDDVLGDVNDLEVIIASSDSSTTARSGGVQLHQPVLQV